MQPTAGRSCNVACTVPSSTALRSKRLRRIPAALRVSSELRRPRCGRLLRSEPVSNKHPRDRLGRQRHVSDRYSPFTARPDRHVALEHRLLSHAHRWRPAAEVHGSLANTPWNRVSETSAGYQRAESRNRSSGASTIAVVPSDRRVLSERRPRRLGRSCRRSFDSGGA